LRTEPEQYIKVYQPKNVSGKFFYSLKSGSDAFSAENLDSSCTFFVKEVAASQQARISVDEHSLQT
jgi:hypothetical protein